MGCKCVGKEERMREERWANVYHVHSEWSIRCLMRIKASLVPLSSSSHIMCPRWWNPHNLAEHLDTSVHCDHEAYVESNLVSFTMSACSSFTLLLLSSIQGGKIRAILMEILANQSDVSMTVGFDGPQSAYQGMRTSKFCLVPEGESSQVKPGQGG